MAEIMPGVTPRPEKLYYLNTNVLRKDTLGVTPKFARRYWTDHAFLDGLQGKRPHKSPERIGAELLHLMWQQERCYVWPRPDKPTWKLIDYRWEDHIARERPLYPGASIAAVYGTFRNPNDYSERYRKFEDRAVLRASFDLKWKPMVVLTAAVGMAAAIKRAELGL